MQSFFWIFGILNLGNGLWMLLAPHAWYQHLPAAVPDTGPYNPHFVRDIGCAFATLGVAFCAAAPRPAYRRAVMMAAALFYVLHAGTHVADLVAGRLPADHWLIDLPGVFLPAILLSVLSLPRWWRTMEV